MKLSLRGKFLLPTLAILVTGFAILGAANYRATSKALNATSEAVITKTREVMDESIRNYLNYVSRSIEDRLTNWVVEGRQNEVQMWGRQDIYKTAMADSYMGRAARRQANDELKRLSEQSPFYESLILVNPAGEIVASSREETIGKINVGDRQYFKDALAGRSTISEAIESRTTGNPIFVVAAPVSDDKGVIGVFAGVVDLQAFSSKFIDPVKIGNKGYAYLLSKDGIVLAHPAKKHILKLDVKTLPYGAKLMAGEGFVTYEFENVTKVVSLSQSKQLGWIVGVGADQEELLAQVTAAEKQVRESQTGALSSIRNVSIGIGLGVAAVAVLVVFLVTASISRSMQNIIEHLSGNAGRLADSSHRITDSSRELADGATRQASSLEESSAALEELAGQAHGNAQKAELATDGAQKARESAEEANLAMQRTVETMSGIRESSGKVSGIIRTIEEIAFQTNLLALNAAVEAARAGEHGKGFAVVAEEVRNLAQRAATAARDTSGLIQSSVEQANRGSQVVDAAAKAIAGIVEVANEVAEHTREVTEASNQQSEGIAQINRAVAQMDEVTQQVASGAEHASTASDELTAQAREMKNVVNELIVLVEGSLRSDATEEEDPSPRHEVTAIRHVTVKQHEPPKKMLK